MQDATKKIKVKVLRDICIGAGSCEIICPKVFKLDQERKAVVLDQGNEPDQNDFIEVSQDTYQNVLDAAKSCPVSAIIAVDEDGKQIYP